VDLFLEILKTVLFVAVCSLLGQAIVGIFNWGGRRDNFIYQLFGIIASPFTKLVRLVTPRVVVDQHIPFATLLVLMFAYGGVLVWQTVNCAADTSQIGCKRVAETRQGSTQ
jgi:hypothetical protein